MAKETNGLTKRELLALNKNGRLLGEIFSYTNMAFLDDKTQDRCVDLHNDNKIDFLELLDQNSFDAAEPTRFFRGQHFYCSIIPRLNAPVPAMIAAVKRLVTKGGADLAANQPNAAFQEWCRADFRRAREIIEAARSGDSSALTFALTAANAIDDAIYFATEGVDEAQLSAVFALGRMKYPNADKANAALDAIVSALDRRPDDVLCANALSTALEVGQSQDQVTERVLQIVKAALGRGGSQTQFVAARGIWSNKGALTADIVPLLLDKLISIPPDNKGTVDELDLALRALLDLGYEDNVKSFLETFLKESTFDFDDLDSFSHQLKRAHRTVLYKITISWLLSGEYKLCAQLPHVLNSMEDDDILRELTIDWTQLTPVQCVFVARKAIGYLFSNPIVPLSIIIALLKHERTAGDALSQLLLDPLLVNYSGKTREYLERSSSADPTHEFVIRALLSANAYQETVSSTGEIKELHPSEDDRQVDRIREMETARKIRRDAAEKSIFRQLVHNSTLLHGRRSLMYVGLDGDERPVEMELQSHSVSIELPRMEVIDPVGLDYLLRVFRAEKFRI